ncbi:MAG TPA: glycosyltransferase family A protein [Bryobacteraceae bacterium]|jgi:hypothetical protein|nr:glycosyltransferase family A protein [Bryobacteraceae bacterium]
MKWRAVPPANVALLDAETEPLFAESERALSAELEGCASAVAILLPWRNAPEYDSRDDGTVRSFLCGEAVLDRLLADRSGAPEDRLCYLLLQAILNGELVAGPLVVRQLPYHRRETVAADGEEAALLMAHRGSPDHLRIALSYLPNPNGSGLKIRVGLDLEDLRDYHSLAARHNRVEFFQGLPAPAGPYVIRQELAELSSEPFFVFHDSDDVSCSDRLSTLQAEILRTDCGLVGCHELQVDEIAGQVRALRYPLDVTGALRTGPNYALLHGASMIRRQAFFAAGGFSTDRMISHDTQFLYRAWFHIRMRNADRFLYIRRVHSKALTASSATKIGSDFRRAIERPWAPDFEAVKSGKLDLSKSTLMPVRTDTGHQLVPFAAGS